MKVGRAAPSELQEFRLASADQLRCVEAGASEAFCQRCEACQLNGVLSQVSQWVSRAGDHSKRRFVLGLVRRLRSTDLLRHLVQLLAPLASKDSTYARSRLKPSQSTDLITAGSDRALAAARWETIMGEVFGWFQSCNYWTKANFLLAILRLCDAHLLHNVASLAKSLLTQELRKKSPVMRAASSAQQTALSEPTLTAYREEPFPELNRLLRSLAGIDEPQDLPEERREKLVEKVKRKKEEEVEEEEEWEAEIFNDETDGEEEEMVSMVLSASTKAYSGVQARVDFIRHLPIHLSKYILNHLDEKSLKRAQLVSAAWKRVALEVLREVITNQQVREEVMLMQEELPNGDGGAAANAVNPTYAQDIDVLVPNVLPGTSDLIFNSPEDAERYVKCARSQIFKTECSFANAYQGLVTRKVIMEERNVYCGGYNVLVLKSREDASRVLHTDGSKMIALGSADRKIRFLDIENGRDVGPTIHGHAGSIKSLYLCSKRGFVLSGSYDTSVRRWDIHSATCQKIYRGHMGSVIALAVHKDMFATGSMDCLCKVWKFEQRKSVRTLKHRHPVTAVAIGDTLVISGDQKGKVKVWSLTDGKLVKFLKGHSDEVTSITFDRWHIVSAAKDGYALVWSAVGYHAVCLTALRHPKAVLCAELQYLRVITGAEDGRLRIWNLLTGQCCRIMRGNSRSDPLKQICAIEDRITVNTSGNILALNFEPIKWSYVLEDDKVPPLIQYSHFRDAPVRRQPHPYIRAQRLRLAGSGDTRVLRPPSRKEAHAGLEVDGRDGIWTAIAPLQPGRPPSGRQRSAGGGGGGSPVGTRQTTKTEEEKKKEEEEEEEEDEDEDEEAKEEEERKEKKKEEEKLSRRISWSFERPVIPPTEEPELNSIKALLKRQLRTPPADLQKPEFIELTVDALQAGYPAREESQRQRSLALVLQGLQVAPARRLTRPSSSPSRLDPRTKVSAEESNWRALLSPAREEVEAVEEEEEEDVEEDELRMTESPLPVELRDAAFTPQRQVIKTGYVAVPVRPCSGAELSSRHSKTTRTTIPRSRHFRPHSAAAPPPTRPPSAPAPRPKSAISFRRPASAVSDGGRSIFSPSGPQPPSPSITPMLMYPKGMLDGLQTRKAALADRLKELAKTNAANPFKDPFRANSDLNLRTYEQDKAHLQDMEDAFEARRLQEDAQDERERRQRWLRMATTRKPRPKTAT